LEKITLHDILQPIAGVLSEAEHFWRIIDDKTWITTSNVSNEHIRHALSSAFPQQRIDKPSQLIKRAKSNSWTLIIESLHRSRSYWRWYGIVAKNYVKRRHFNNGKSPQLSTTLQTILFGKGIRLGIRLHRQLKLTWRKSNSLKLFFR